MNPAEQAAQMLIANERRRQVHHRYESGGWMIALDALTIEIDGEPWVIPAGHRLTLEEALNYPGEVLRVYDKRPWRLRMEDGTETKRAV